jgi:hypothetical protein
MLDPLDACKHVRMSATKPAIAAFDAHASGARKRKRGARHPVGSIDAGDRQ